MSSKGCLQFKHKVCVRTRAHARNKFTSTSCTVRGWAWQSMLSSSRISSSMYCRASSWDDSLGCTWFSTYIQNTHTHTRLIMQKWTHQTCFKAHFHLKVQRWHHSSAHGNDMLSVRFHKTLISFLFFNFCSVGNPRPKDGMVWTLQPYITVREIFPSEILNWWGWWIEREYTEILFVTTLMRKIS